MTTIKDVAKRAQVSTATVSYVINKKENVSAELVAKVNQAIEELNYRPSRVARSLRQGKTMTLGLLMDDISNQFGAEFTRGLVGAARRKDYTVIISNMNREGEEERRCLEQLVSQQVDGIIYSGYGFAEDVILNIREDGIPVVSADVSLRSPLISSVLIDNRRGMFQTVEYLVGIGKTRMCYIAGYPDNPNTMIRVEAFQEALQTQGFPCGGEDICFGDYSLNHGYQSVWAMNDCRQYQAFVCGDDLVAFGVISALKHKQIRIPEEAVVVGFDNVPLAPYFDPSLTTIHYPMKMMGVRSFELFYKQVTGRRKKPEHVLMETTLVIRKSTDSSLPAGIDLEGD